LENKRLSSLTAGISRAGFFFTREPRPDKVTHMNDYDKASRYMVKRDPSRIFPWLLRSPTAAFEAWIDARRVALPDQRDLTNDLVAAVGQDGTREAVCLELEAEARADAVTRVLGYALRVWTEPEGEGSLPITCATGVIVDLTGRSASKELILRSKIVAGCELNFVVLRRSLADEDAASLIAGAASGKVSPWLLGWVPLMQQGRESAIIAPWRKAAERRMLDARARADLGSLALVFSTLGGCRAAWELGLKGWNMKTSPFLDEIRAEGREEGRAKGREEGRMDEVRAMLLRQGRRKFRAAPSRKQQQTLKGITDLGQLEALAERLVDVKSWTDLLANGQ
jgi:hypothetical protein